MQSAIRSFLAHLRSTRKMMPNTVRAYSADLSHYAGALLRAGVSRPAGVDGDLCARYLEGCEAEGHAASTRRRRTTALRQFHAWAHASGLTTTNPAEHLCAAAKRYRLPRVLTEAEVAALIAATDLGTPNGTRDRALLELAYSGALRISEVLGLDVADLSLERREVRVTGKGGREAIVPFGETAAEALRHYLAHARDQLAPATDALFVAIGGGRLSARTVRNALVLLSRKAGVSPAVNPHALRHSCATHLHARGADVLDLKELLRHRQLETTLIYTHFDRTRIREVLRRFHPRG